MLGLCVMLVFTYIDIGTPISVVDIWEPRPMLMDGKDDLLPLLVFNSLGVPEVIFPSQEKRM